MAANDGLVKMRVLVDYQNEGESGTKSGIVKADSTVRVSPKRAAELEGFKVAERITDETQAAAAEETHAKAGKRSR